MNSKERVLTTLARQAADRVPINYFANPGIDLRLKQYFGLAADDDEGLRQLLGVDFRGVAVPYCGPTLHQDIPERGVKVDLWGIHRRWVEHETGGYWDYCDFPLRDATEEEVAQWPMPSPDDFDYSGIAEACQKHKAYAVFIGNAGQADVINMGGMLRGMEQTLVDLLTAEPAGLLLAKRRTDIQLEVLRRTLEAANGGIDFLWMGEDLGTQIGPMISVALYRKQIRPIHQKFVDLAKSFNIPVMLHSCGSSSWAYTSFIEMSTDTDHRGKQSYGRIVVGSRGRAVNATTRQNDHATLDNFHISRHEGDTPITMKIGWWITGHLAAYHSPFTIHHSPFTIRYFQNR